MVVGYAVAAGFDVIPQYLRHVRGECDVPLRVLTVLQWGVRLGTVTDA